MKKIFVRSSVAFCAFLIGILVTPITTFFTQFPQIEVPTDSTEIYRFSDNKIEIGYKYTLISKEYSDAVFVVTNYSKESIYYYGYDKNSHVRNWINQNGKIELATDLPCFNGVEEQELKPNESAIFEIPVPRNKRTFEAGFDFKKINGDWKTEWIKVNEQNRFVATSSNLGNDKR